jgi:two-component sensor histidine kinase
VEVRWTREGEALGLRWRERGGPPVSAPTRRGFGSRLLDASLRDLGGETRLDYAVSGVTAEFSAPL